MRTLNAKPHLCHATGVFIQLGLMGLASLWAASALAYSPTTDPIRQLPPIPYFFWHTDTAAAKDRICAKLGCDPNYAETHQSTLQYLTHHLEILHSHPSRQRTPPSPDILVVKHYPDPHHPDDALVFLSTHATWTNVVVKESKHIYNPLFYPQKHLRITPDHVELKRFDKLINPDDLPLRPPTKRWFHTHRRWLSQTLKRCHFYPYQRNPLGVLLSSCQGQSIQSYATQIVGIEPYLIIPARLLETTTPEDLLAAMLRTLADYDLALPAFDSLTNLENLFTLLITDQDHDRHDNDSTGGSTSTTLEYDLSTVDSSILLSPELMMILATIDDHLRHQLTDHSSTFILTDPESSGYIPIEPPAFSESPAAGVLTTKLGRTKAYYSHQQDVLSWLESLGLPSELTPHTLLHAAAYLGHKLPFHLFLRLQTELINHYNAYSFNRILKLLDFNQLEDNLYGLTKLTPGASFGEDELVAATLEITEHLKLTPALISNNYKSNFKTMLDELDKALLRHDLITVPTIATQVTLTGPELSQLYQFGRFRHHNLILDPDFFLILAILESHYATHTLFHNQELALSLNQFLYSYSHDAKTLVNQLLTSVVTEDHTQIAQHIAQRIPYAHNHPHIHLSTTNLLLLIGLYYERIPVYALTAIEQSIVNFYLDNPLGELDHALNFNDITQHNFFLEGRFHFPKPIRSRIKVLLQFMVAKYDILDPASWDFFDYAQTISNLLHLHKKSLADKHLNLILGGRYLYNFNLRQDEITQYYVKLAQAPPHIYTQYLINQLPDLAKRRECQNLLQQPHPQLLISTLVPLMNTLGQYPLCWRAINTHLEHLRHS